ncbi:MAG: DUF935 family protein [Bryobacteraceae bacterium]
MSLLTRAAQILGLADRPAANVAARSAPDLTEYGATGTPILAGYLQDLGEYNSALEGLSAFATYEKMRRSDAQVAATLAGMKLPIRSADWVIAEPDDASPVEQEAAEFIRQCLFEDIDFGALLSNALLMLDFGCSAHEDVYRIDGNRVRLAKCAPRLPVTFSRWMTAGEDLVAIEQQGYRGETYITVSVPIEKLALFTFHQEGANYAGRSVLRPVYQHWYIKSSLYKIDAIAQERNGMGVPWARMGEDAKVEDRRTANEWLQQLCAHERAAILLPPGWEFGLKGVEGTLRDPKDSISHHNMQISMAGLAQFMMLGQTESGNRALGQTMSDFFYLSLQATANQLARILTLTTIRRLVDYNFAGIKRYPRLVPQQILTLQFESLWAALQGLATSKLVEPDDDLEGWLRKKMGAPAKAKPRTAAPAPRPAEMRESHRGRCIRCQESSITTWRAPRGAERFLALDEIVSELDRGRDEVAAAIRRARPAIQAEIVNKLVNTPVRQMHRVSIPPDEKLIATIETILDRVQEFGYDQVEAERDRQRAGQAPGDAAQIRLAESGRRRERDPLGVYADATVSEVTNTLTQRAANAALDWMRRPGDLHKGEIIRKIEGELDAQSDKWIDGAASKGTNEAFADGRSEGYEAHKDEISNVYYSALLDMNTCEACAAADGQSGRTPDEIPAVPNPDCEGGDKCRCVHIFIFGDELPSAGPGSAGSPEDALPLAPTEQRVLPETVSGLAAELADDTGFQALAADTGRTVEEEVNRLLTVWTTDVKAKVETLALQLAAETEFSLPRTSWGKISPDVLPAAADVIQRHGGALQSFLRTMYNRTQQWLENQGIASLNLHRGMAGAVRGERSGIVEFRTRGISSFTTDLGIAVDYAGEDAGCILSVQVPRERVLSTAVTGLGDPKAKEVVVLAGWADQARYRGWLSAAAKPTLEELRKGRLEMADKDQDERKIEGPPIEDNDQNWLRKVGRKLRGEPPLEPDETAKKPKEQE